jgi:CheY-like chemotaxis protein
MNTKIRRPCVLLVEDHADAREMYSEYLRLSGFDVVQAANGVEALLRAREAVPDIILMDLSMPLMDGWEATRYFKSNSQTAGIPVVAFSGQTLEGTSEGAERAGCDAFVAKSCLTSDLVEQIRKLLECGSPATAKRTRRHSTIPRTPAVANGSPAARPRALGV